MTKKERIAALELEVAQLKSQLHMLGMRFDAYLKSMPTGTPQAVPAPWVQAPFKLGSTLRANTSPHLLWNTTYIPSLNSDAPVQTLEHTLSRDEVRKMLLGDIEKVQIKGPLDKGDYEYFNGDEDKLQIKPSPGVKFNEWEKD
jgi:hypothetical protein